MGVVRLISMVCVWVVVLLLIKKYFVFVRVRVSRRDCCNVLIILFFVVVLLRWFEFGLRLMGLFVGMFRNLVFICRFG